MATLLDGSLQLQTSSQDVHRLGETIDRASSRLSVAFLVASLIIGSSLIVLSQPQALRHLGELGLVGFCLAGLLSCYLIWSLIFNRKK